MWKIKKSLIECFHSRGQHLCKFIGTKESVCIRKEFNSQRIGLGHQHGRCFIVLGNQYGHRDVMLKHSITSNSTRLIRTLSMPPSESVLTDFDCNVFGGPTCDPLLILFFSRRCVRASRNAFSGIFP